MTLTKAQFNAALMLLQKRPAVIPGTRVILGDVTRSAFYGLVNEALAEHGIVDQKAINEFCDLAGVPD